MRELNCVIRPNSQGWLLTVGNRRRVWFPSKDSALRAAIAEAQRGRASGFYSSVKVRHGRVGGTQAMPAMAVDVSDLSVNCRSSGRFRFASMQPPKR